MGTGTGCAQGPPLGQRGMDGSPQGDISERTEVTAWVTVKAAPFRGWVCTGGEEGAPLPPPQP